MNWELVIGIVALGVSFFSIGFTVFRTKKSDKERISEKYHELITNININLIILMYEINRLISLKESNKPEVQSDAEFINKIETEIKNNAIYRDKNIEILNDCMKKYPRITLEEINNYLFEVNSIKGKMEITKKSTEELIKIFRTKN